MPKFNTSGRVTGWSQGSIDDVETGVLEDNDGDGQTLTICVSVVIVFVVAAGCGLLCYREITRRKRKHELQEESTRREFIRQANKLRLQQLRNSEDFCSSLNEEHKATLVRFSEVVAISPALSLNSSINEKTLHSSTSISSHFSNRNDNSNKMRQDLKHLHPQHRRPHQHQQHHYGHHPHQQQLYSAHYYRQQQYHHYHQTRGDRRGSSDRLFHQRQQGRTKHVLLIHNSCIEKDIQYSSAGCEKPQSYTSRQKS